MQAPVKSPDGSSLSIGRRLTLTLALLIAIILGGNGLVVMQFERARMQTDRLTGVSQQLIAVLRLQEGLLAFHQRVNDLARSRDRNRLVTEVKLLHSTLLEQTRKTRSTLDYLPPEFRVDAAFLTALDAFETTLPVQIDEISALAAADDWDVVRRRLDNELQRMETTISVLAKSIDHELAEELPSAVGNMRDMQRRIFFIVPATAISTVLIAAFFGWAMARRMLELRIEARVAERTRIARELHDTLLQSFQGILMKFQAVAYRLADRPEAREALEQAVEQARQAIIEGRDTVTGLRGTISTDNDVARAIRSIGEGLAAEQTDGQDDSLLLVHVEGEARDLAPLVRDEVYRIAIEALRNAFRHANAKRIDVDIHYDKRRFRLQVRDNGQGIHSDILVEGGRAGRYGLAGMRERAKLIGGELEIRSELNSGTEVALSIPGSLAFAKSPHTSPPVVSGKGSD